MCVCCQLEISSLERSRSVMAEEVVRLTNQNDDMDLLVKDIPRLQVQLKVSSARHRLHKRSPLKIT